MRTPRQIQSLLKPINGFEKHSIKSKVNRKVIKVNDETYSSVKVDGTNPRQVLKRFSEYESNSASQNYPSKRCRFEDNKSLSAELSSQFLLMNVEERSDQVCVFINIFIFIFKNYFREKRIQLILRL